ncbi:hypothetical protein DFH09DRAFT_1081118 [Mycena vulgaris]|nr:hypothetical protein DFH09DRAFT_1081118 [Mycena vulgaris]
MDYLNIYGQNDSDDESEGVGVQFLETKTPSDGLNISTGQGSSPGYDKQDIPLPSNAQDVNILELLAAVSLDPTTQTTRSKEPPCKRRHPAKQLPAAMKRFRDLDKKHSERSDCYEEATGCDGVIVDTESQISGRKYTELDGTLTWTSSATSFLLLLPQNEKDLPLEATATDGISKSKPCWDAMECVPNVEIQVNLKSGRTLGDALHLGDPSADEIQRFEAADRTSLQWTAAPGYGLGLDEGSHVVVKSGGNRRHEGRTGYIWTTDFKTATVRQHYKGQQILQANSNFWSQLTKAGEEGVPGTDDFEVEFSLLERHALSAPLTLHECNQVAVTVPTGDSMARHGRVAAMERSTQDPNVTVISPELEEFSVPMSQLRRIFRLGDLVKAVAGLWKGEREIIVKMHSGGRLELFNERYGLGARAKPLDVMFKVVTAEIELEVTGPGIAWGGSGSCPSFLSAEDKRHEQEMEDEIKLRPGYYRGKDILIQSPHMMEGIVGVVIDNHDSLPAENTLTVRRKSSNDTFQVPISQAVHRWSHLPLAEAIHVIPWAGPLKWGWPNEAYPRKPTVSSMLTAEGNTRDGGRTHNAQASDSAMKKRQRVEAHPTTHPDLHPPSIPEHGGLWLCIANLAGKRVDVTIGVKTQGRKPLSVRVGEYGTVLRIEPTYLKPKRTTQHLPQMREDVCIGEQIGRVVIIGPDANGNCTRLGDYAETCPGMLGVEPSLVKVRYLPANGVPSGTAIYHLKSLCRAFNVDGVLTQATRFL